MYKKILVPLDGSNAAEIALPYAQEISAGMTADMILISVSEPTVDDRDHLFRYYLEGLSQKTHREPEELGAGGESVPKIEVLFGKPADEILGYADEEHVDLIIMASRGRSGLGPWLLGNIAAKVLRATEKPVLLVRAPAGDSALPEKRLLRKILVPLDGSDLGETTLSHAEALAKNLGAEIVLLRALEPPRPLEGEGAYTGKKLHFRSKEETERRKAAAMEYLDAVGRPLREKGLKVSRAVLSGLAAEEIIDYARDNGIDLIAMSSHGRSGIGRWVFGSVTDKVVHAGDTPVLVVRAAKVSQ
jgi:nucleotide-binding universal stress UspA family protein